MQVHDTTTNTVHDTVRETTTVYIDADGDTTRKDTEREHITDRSRERRNERVGEKAQGESHEKETAEKKFKELVSGADKAVKKVIIKKNKANRIKSRAQLKLNKMAK